MHDNPNPLIRMQILLTEWHIMVFSWISVDWSSSLVLFLCQSSSNDLVIHYGIFMDDCLIGLHDWSYSSANHLQMTLWYIMVFSWMTVDWCSWLVVFLCQSSSNGLVIHYGSFMDDCWLVFMIDLIPLPIIFKWPCDTLWYFHGWLLIGVHDWSYSSANHLQMTLLYIMVFSWITVDWSSWLVLFLCQSSSNDLVIHYGIFMDDCWLVFIMHGNILFDYNIAIECSPGIRINLFQKCHVPFTEETGVSIYSIITALWGLILDPYNRASYLWAPQMRAFSCYPF